MSEYTIPDYKDLLYIVLTNYDKQKSYSAWVHKVSKEIIYTRTSNKCFILKKNKIIDCFGKERNMTYYAFGLYTNTSSR